MSLQHTESFMAYRLTSGDDVFNPENVATINAAAAALRRGGYDIYTAANTSVATSGGLVPRPDMVFANRAALYHSCGAATPPNAVTAGIRKRFPIVRLPLIGGFSLYIPAEFVKDSASSAVTLFRISAPPGAGNTAWQDADASGSDSTEICRINADLLVRWKTEAPLSSKALEVGRINYIEYRITDTEIRVWVDSTLVLQKAYSVLRETIALTFLANTPAAGVSGMQGITGRWAIGNWYNLYEDSIAPNARLGPTTRVIGARPTDDVSVDFTRPAEAPSNASIVAQDLVDAPPLSLQSSRVGDEDIYSTSADTETESGAMIHAVVAKVMAGSLDGSTHTIRPLIRSGQGVEAVDERAPALQSIGTIPDNLTIVGMARRPTDNALFAITANAIYRTPANGDGKQWSLAYSESSAITSNCIRFRADGAGVIGRSDGKLWVLLPDVDTPALVSPSSSTTSLVDVTVTTTGRFVLVGPGSRCVRLNTDTGALTANASWTSSLIGSGLNLVSVVCNKSNRLLAVVGATTGAVYTSDNDAGAWTLRNTGAPSQAFTSAACDGDQFYVFGALQFGSASYCRRSTDGVSWTDLVTPNYNRGLGGSTANPAAFAKGDELGNVAGVVVGGGGTPKDVVFVQQIGTNMYKPELFGTLNTMRAATTTVLGYWVLGGDNGALLSLRPQPVDAVLVPFSGYIPTFNAAAFNPSTGLPWTPAEAAAAQFGMRVTT